MATSGAHVCSSLNPISMIQLESKLHAGHADCASVRKFRVETLNS